MLPRIEVIAIGSELLLGKVINSNAAFISEKLFSIGLSTRRHLAIDDSIESMKQAFQSALAENDIVITTGGLGPTLDDLTRVAVSELFDAPLIHNATVFAHLKKRYGDQLLSLEDQATCPEGALPLLNQVGTAPGIILEKNNKLFIMLPGVPTEMRPMMQHQLLPFLQERFPIKHSPLVLDLFLHSLRESEVDIPLRELQAKYPRLTFGIYPHLGTLTIRIQGNEEAHLATNSLKALYKDHLMLYPTLQESIHHKMIGANLTLSTAESCTGGAIAASLALLPGASRYFLGSIVSYSNEVKSSLLNVPESLIHAHGAVSAEVAAAMATGLLTQIPSDFGIAVTGIAGPSGGTPDKPVGTVWIAVIKRGEIPHLKKLEFSGSRESTIIRATHAALATLHTAHK